MASLRIDLAWRDREAPELTMVSCFHEDMHRRSVVPVEEMGNTAGPRAATLFFIQAALHYLKTPDQDAGAPFIFRGEAAVSLARLLAKKGRWVHLYLGHSSVAKDNEPMLTRILEWHAESWVQLVPGKLSPADITITCDKAIVYDKRKITTSADLELLEKGFRKYHFPRARSADRKQAEACRRLWAAKELEPEPPSPPACPYRGLGPFLEQHREFFFGRDQLSQRLYDKVRESAVVPVVGPSGCGKTSAVFAGLVPRLRNDRRWYVSGRITPGDSPFEQLAAGLLAPGTSPESSAHLAQELRREPHALRDWIASFIAHHTMAEHFLLIVDQLEELFTECKSEDTQRAFLESIVQAAAGPGDERTTGVCRLLFTVRSDFLPRVQAEPCMSRVLTEMTRVNEMMPDELLSAIQRPLPEGVFFEGDLAAVLRDAAGTGPGYLPLLEFALEALWRDLRWDPNRAAWELTFAAYTDLGGLDGAISKYADKTLEALTEHERRLARSIFLHLVHPGTKPDGSEHLRRRVALEALVHSEPGRLAQQAEEVVEHFCRARLLVKDSDPATNEVTVEVAHEALIRWWKKLRRWVHEHREFLDFRERLDIAAANKLFLRGKLLDEARSWLVKHRHLLEPPQRSFILENLADVIAALGPQELPALVRGLGQAALEMAPQLRDRVGHLTADDDPRGTALRLALLPADEAQAVPLTRRMLASPPEEFQLLLQELSPYRNAATTLLWEMVGPPWAADRGRRFRAACALASWDPDNAAWGKENEQLLQQLAADLVWENHLAGGGWANAVRPLAARLLPHLLLLFQNSGGELSLGGTVAGLVADYAAGDADLLGRLASEAAAGQFGPVFEALRATRTIPAVLPQMVRARPAAGSAEAERTKLARLRAGAAITLLRLGVRAQAMRVFRVRESLDGLEAMAQFLNGLRARGVRPAEIAGCLARARSLIQRLGLVLALGEFTRSEVEEALPAADYRRLVSFLKSWHAGDGRCGFDDACLWVLLRWGNKPEPPWLRPPPIGNGSGPFFRPSGATFASREYGFSWSGYLGWTTEWSIEADAAQHQPWTATTLLQILCESSRYRLTNFESWEAFVQGFLPKSIAKGRHESDIGLRTPSVGMGET
jgi:hypothetical protein